MPPTMEAAFAAVAGPRLDLLAGLEVPKRPHRTVEPAIEDVSHTLARAKRLAVRAVIARHSCQVADAEEATQEALCTLFAGRRELFREDAANWQRLLNKVACTMFVASRAGTVRVDPAGGLEEMIMDERDVDRSPVRPNDGRSDYRDVSPPLPGEPWTDAQILGAFQRFLEHHGRAPRARECRKMHQLPSVATIRKHFGGFAKALLAAGMVPPRRRRHRWGPVDAARACCAFRLRHGRWPDGGDLRRNPGLLPTEETARKYFGGIQPGVVQVNAERILAALPPAG